MEKKWIKEQIISARMKTSDVDKLKQIADSKEISLSNLIRDIIKEYIKNK